MKLNRKTIFIPGILCFLLMGNFYSIAQQRCGTVEYSDYKKRLNPNLENKRSFEDWLKKQKLQKAFESSFSRTEALIITIPIVVHVDFYFQLGINFLNSFKTGILEKFF